MASATIKDAHGLILTMPRNPELPPADLVESWLTVTFCAVSLNTGRS